MSDRLPRRLAWGTLVYLLAVVVWGAYVRVTGSGAGCGRHWPTCQGEIVPRSPTVETLIEYSHRVTSGLALILVVATAVSVWRRRAPRSARRAALAAVVVMLLEAALGAGLVLFELVADNPSLVRAWVMGAHLINTFMLLAASALAAYWLTEPAPRRWSGAGPWLAGALLLTLVGASGAIAALGDTLFPARSLSEGVRADFAASAHVLLRLRIWHPVLAIAGALVTIGLSAWCRRAAALPTVRTRVLGRSLAALAGLQVAIGATNLVLLAPAALQLLHLFVADLLWLAFVLTAVSALADRNGAADR